jgi:HEAT repeat protein
MFEEIFEVLPFLIGRRRNVAVAAAAEIHKHVLATPKRELAWLDWELRRRTQYSPMSFYEWQTLSPQRIGMLEGFGDASVSLLGLASFHSSGYVREAAIEKLSRVKSGTEIPFLLLRLDDWVPEIRNAAATTIRARLTTAHCKSFTESLPLLVRLQRAARADRIVEEINDLIQSAGCGAALFESLKSPDRLVRRESFRLALNSQHVEEVAELALKDDDTAIRRRAAEKIASAFIPNFEPLLDLMKRDRYVPVRREALRLSVKLNGPHIMQELHAALLDQHQSMREEARYHLRRMHPTDFAAFYRHHLIESVALYSAISGLGETGRAEDDALIVPYAQHFTAKIRRAAIRALAALRPDAHVETFMKALADETPNVSRQALKALARRVSLVGAARFWELFNSTPHTHVKRNALSLIEKCAKWDAIAYLVKARWESDDEILMLSGSAIRRWLLRFNRSFTSPNAEQVANLKAALETYGELIDEKTREQLWFSLKGFEA